MKNCITFAGLDVHKNSIDVALADGDREGEVRYYGTIGGDHDSLDRLVRKLVSKKQELHFVYEAGPCGYDIYRSLTVQGFDCAVVAPSGTPKKGNQRVKNDRRDAITLARLHRAKELTYVFVPKEADEAMRDLVRGKSSTSNAPAVGRHAASLRL